MGCLQPAVLLAPPFSYIERVFVFACFREGKMTEPDVHSHPQNKETYGNISTCVSKCVKMQVLSTFVCQITEFSA